MLDIKFIRENPEIVKANMRRKFRENVEIVDEVIALDSDYRASLQKLEDMRAQMNATAKKIGAMMAQAKKEEAEAAKSEVSELKKQIPETESEVALSKTAFDELILKIPQIIADDVPLGRDDSENV
ncbi:MAG: serine--tRNA ligase, partial [Oscillospiraceae bacterium]|nr:serine--tRNA ligase [Oscillospiraceae bacterium]